MKKIIQNSIQSLPKIIFLAYTLFLFLISPHILFADSEIGAFVGNADHRTPYDYEVRNFETLTGRHLNSVLMYWAWNDGDFPAAGLNQGVRYHDGYDTKTIIHLTWEPWSREGGSDQTYMLSNIISGAYDSYITKFAQDCRDWQDPVRLRFAHEMIQDNNPNTIGWYPWQDRPAEYVQAWNHVYQIFKNENANNVQFVWAPNNYPADLSTLSQYYPGADKVEWLGIDGYNAGEDGMPGWPYWQNFDDLFYNLYTEMTEHPEIFGDKEIMLAEFASAEGNIFDSGNKGEWILDAFDAIKNRYSQIDAFYWFNTLKEEDWRINSSPESLAAFQSVMQDSYYTSHVVPEPNMAILMAAGAGYILTMLKSNNKY